MRYALPLIALLGCTNRYVVEDEALARATAENAEVVPAYTRGGDPVHLRTDHITDIVDENPPYLLVETRDRREGLMAVGALAFTAGIVGALAGVVAVGMDGGRDQSERLLQGSGVVLLGGAALFTGAAIVLDGPEVDGY